MVEEKRSICPDCNGGITRRDFVRTVGGAAVAAGALPLLGAPRGATAAPSPESAAETAVKRLYDSLTDTQREVVCLPFEHPLRRRVNANWAVTEPAIEEFFTAEQQKNIEEILKGVTSEDGYDRFQRQMDEDAGGLGQYHIAIFGEPGTSQFEWEMTGRHFTIRADGNSVENAAFGGPIVYGHAPEFTERPGHPGNVFWYQAKRANEVFQMLDGKQREMALLEQAPKEAAVQIRKKGEKLPGIPGSALSPDQKELLEKVLADIMAPYRREDVDEVMQIMKAGGGMDQVHISFYKNDADGSPDGDLGRDGVWDIWRLESPTLVCHFRGSPHIHAYINVAKPA